MTRRRTEMFLALALTTAFSAAGCAKGTYLEIQFNGSGFPELRAIDVTLDVTAPDGGSARSHGPIGRDPDAGVPFSLPTSAAFRLDGQTGTVVVKAQAIDLANQVVGAAPAQTTMIMPDKTTSITMTFAPVSAAAEAAGDSVTAGN